MKDTFLPIGSIVLLKNGTKKIMVTGYLPISNGDGGKKVFDYSACLFPEGILSSDKTAAFNHDQIAEVVFEGFHNEETDKFTTALLELLNKEGNKTINEIAKEQAPAQPEEPVDMPAESAPVENELPAMNTSPEPEMPAEAPQPEPTPEVELPAEAPEPMQMNPEMPAPAPMENELPAMNTSPEPEMPAEAPQPVPAPEDNSTGIELPVIEAPVVGEEASNPVGEVEIPMVNIENNETPVESPAEPEPVPAPAEPVPEPAEPVEQLETLETPIENNPEPVSEDTSEGDQNPQSNATPMSVGVDSIKPFSE